MVFIIPRVGVLAAGQLVSVPRVAEIKGQRDAYAKDKWGKYYVEMEERWRERGAGNNCGGGDPHEDEKTWAMIQEEDTKRKGVENEINAHDMKLRDDLRQRKASRERVANTLTRFSPVSAYQLASMTIAGTETSMKSRYEDSMNAYRTQFVDYVSDQETKAGPGAGHIMITMSSETGFSLSTGEDQSSLDISGLPRYTAPILSFADSAAPAIIDFGLLILYILAAFAGSFISFLRCDIK